MSIPDPIYPLSGHCSVVHEETLYTYSPKGFQSLALKEGAKWRALSMDISLTGAQCVKAVPDGDAKEAKLYIVGGSVNETASGWGYKGLMHYHFAQKKWDWVRPESAVSENRQNHAAVYIDSAKAILVYSGSQTTGDVGPSSSSFLISTEDPFRITSTPSDGAPPAVKPMLMPWSESNAVMFGGGAENTAVFLFDAEIIDGQPKGWQNLSVTLPEPFTNQDSVQSTVISGEDGSKMLEKFDMTVIPNKVERIKLLNAGGTPVQGKSKRFTISEWNAYNGTLAPKVTRSGYSIAQDESGLAIISGGSDTDPLCVFDQQENSWRNATEMFLGQQVLVKSTTSTSSAAPSATSATTASTAEPIDKHKRMMTVLGATLGAIFGIAAILVLILLCLKYRKSKKNKADPGYIEKNRLSFADRGAEFMSEAGGAVGQHHYSASMNGSRTSLAIVSGRNHKRGTGPLGSDASTAGLVKTKSPMAYSDPVELSKFDLKPEPVVIDYSKFDLKPPAQDKLVRQNSGRAPPAAVAALGRSRSSGWSKYFANNVATNLAHMGSNRSTYASDRTSTGSQGVYTNPRTLHPQANMPTLVIPPMDNQRVSQVATGSPTLGNSSENLPVQAMSAEIGRADSNGSSRSGISQDYYSERTMKAWDPVTHEDRPPSSAYTNSIAADGHNGPRVSSYYADGSSEYPKSSYSSFYPGQNGNDRPESTISVFPGGNPGAPTFRRGNEGMAPPPRFADAQDRDSTVTIFPRGAPEGPPKPGNQDMSWLNLGAGK